VTHRDRLVLGVHERGCSATFAVSTPVTPRARSGTAESEPAELALRPSPRRRSTQCESELCFLSHSLTLRPWILSYVEGLWSPALRNSQAKAAAYSAASITSSFCRGTFSLKRGLDSFLTLLQAEH